MWKDVRTLVTGGASFIGSALADELLTRGACVRVVDNLSSGKLANIAHNLANPAFEFVQADLLDDGVAADAVKGVDFVFHLAADHGGRGYVDLHQGAIASNLLLDGIVFRACLQARVRRVVYASSGCVYPNYLQTDPGQELLLTEEMVGPPYDADQVYGWAKLMGEMTLEAYYRDFGLDSVSCRFFTVYGERGVENHAVMAMIARAFIGQNPFEIWGTGEQIRNWTYVKDIVRGMVLAAEKAGGAVPVNLGTTERISVNQAAEMVLEMTGHKAELVRLMDMPTGPYNRVADNRRALELLGWRPEVCFREGLRRTIDWYWSVKNREQITELLPRILTER